MTDEDRVLVKNFLKLPDDSRKAVIKFVQKCAVELSAPVQSETTEQEQTVADTTGQERTEPDLAAKVAELERQNQEILRLSQEKDKRLEEMAAEIAVMKEEDAKLGLTDVSSTSPLVSVGKLNPEKAPRP